ncbi:FAT1-like protein, partial [Mya arenaria]
MLYTSVSSWAIIGRFQGHEKGFPILLEHLGSSTIMTSQVLDRETATHYWLTVYAQDHGLVPLHTRLEVYIEVRDVNDHIPLPYQPVYYGSVRENDNNGFVTQVQAFDLDRNLNQSLHYEITRYDPLHFFQIDPKTGKRLCSSRTDA